MCLYRAVPWRDGPFCWGGEGAASGRGVVGGSNPLAPTLAFPDPLQEIQLALGSSPDRRRSRTYQSFATTSQSPGGVSRRFQHP